METFNFPNHTFETEYPQSGNRVQMGGGYIFTSPPSGPDLRRFNLKFPTMFYYENAPIMGPFIDDNLAWSSSSGLPLTTVAASSYFVFNNSQQAMNLKFASAQSLFPRFKSNAYNGVLPVVAGKIYEVTTEIEVQSVGTSVIQVGLAGGNFSAAYGTLTDHTGFPMARTVSAPTNGVYTVTQRVSDLATVTALGGTNAQYAIWKPTTGAFWRIYPILTGTLVAGTTVLVRKFTVTEVAATGVANISRTINPTINMAVLEDFYNRHKLHKSFIYPHPVYGDTTCKFLSPLKIPRGMKGGMGALEDISIELLEIVQ